MLYRLFVVCYFPRGPHGVDYVWTESAMISYIPAGIRLVAKLSGAIVGFMVASMSVGCGLSGRNPRRLLLRCKLSGLHESLNVPWTWTD